MIPLGTFNYQLSGGGGAYLLDGLASARVAYSVRKLRTGQTNCLRVRRSSDSAETDIGFDGDDLDVTSLESFCSATNGYIRTWYDQSGNGNNMVQPTVADQPQIVSSGSVLVEGTVPKIQFDGSHWLYLAGVTIGLPTRCWSAVWKQDAQSTDKRVMSFTPTGATGNDYASSSSFEFQGYNSSRTYYISGGSGGSYLVVKSGFGAVPYDHYWEEVVSGSGELFAGNVSVDTDTGTWDASNSERLKFGVGYYAGGLNGYWNGSIQEFIYWDSDESSDRTTIHDDVSLYYNL